MAASVKTVRALERGLQVFRALDNDEGCSLQHLHTQTGMAKPTLLRLLLTLEQQGFVWRAMGDGLYRRKLVVTEAAPGSARQRELGEIAGPYLERLQRKAIWPSDLLVVRNNRLIAAETSRKRSGLALDFYPIGFRVDFFLSAPGRAYLAWCSDTERERILAFHRRHPPAIPRSLTVMNSELPAILERTRHQGYGARDPQFGGSQKPMSEFDDGLDAIAVPVLQGQRVLACINLVWMRKYRLRSKIVRDHLADLKATAAEIGEAATRAGRQVRPSR